MQSINKFIKYAVASVFLLSAPAHADLSAILSKGIVKITEPEAFAPFGSLGKSGEHEG